MIESCSTKRMILGVSFLGGLTVLVLIFESHWTSGSSHNHLSSGERNLTIDHSTCWLHEDFTISEPCHPCTNFEIASGSIKVCEATHSKEVVLCRQSGKVTRSCDKVTWLDERNFWLFEGFMFVVGVISTTIVFLRQKVLDFRMLRRIQRQLASGV